MRLRPRLTVLTAAIVGLTLLLAAVATYAVMRAELRGQVDRDLAAQGAQIAGVVSRVQALPQRLPPPPADLDAPADFVRLIGPDGEVVPLPGATPERVPLGPGEVVAAPRARTAEDSQVAGERVRVLTQPLPGGGAVQLGRSLETVAATLERLRWTLALLTVGGTLLAAALGRLLADRVIAPITRLTEAAEHVESTADLTRRVPEGGGDEVGRLAYRFNRMLDRLHAAQGAQRQLVADASHELRTPVTSLRTNAEVLRDTPELDHAGRRAIAGDLVEQSEELTALVGDLIELARGDVRDDAMEPVRLDALTEEAVQRARRHAAGVEIVLDARPVVVDAAPERLARAVNNLLDNATAHAPPGTRVDVRVADGELIVRDRGPGIDPADLPHVFDRFYRGASARGREGSGLGLAIVKQVADAHGATVALEPADGGGTLARLAFSPSGRGTPPAPG